ncbi:phosphatase PAP2 family protein [bacterium]|nr:phosphatase PAP2 family protein [bacterium]
MKDNSCRVVENWNYVTLSLVVTVVLALLVLYMPGFREIDAEILKVIRKFLGAFPSYIPAVVTDFGRANYLMWPQITACAVLLSHRKYLKTFLLLFFTQLAYLVVGWMKNFICRERPCLYEGYSFPSGHALTTMCFYGIVIYLVMRYVSNNFWRWFLAIGFGIFIFLVSISRLWLGVHFPSDVLAGVFLGFLLVNLYIILDRFFKN